MRLAGQTAHITLKHIPADFTIEGIAEFLGYLENNQNEMVHMVLHQRFINS
jgi:hypothetical protein